MSAPCFATRDTEPPPPAHDTIRAPRHPDEPPCTIDTVFDGVVDYPTICWDCEGEGVLVVAQATYASPSESAPCPRCDGKGRLE